jgi:hypothetical protein
MVGNLLYSLAVSFQSMPIALAGRILCGFGSAEVANRQMISACVSFERMTRASALFVAASAAGMSIGPLVGAIFDMTAGRDSLVDLRVPIFPAGGIIYDHVTGPGFFMGILWLIQMLCLLLVFREPIRVNVKGSRHKVLDAEVDTIALTESFGSYGSHNSTNVVKSSDESESSLAVKKKHWWRNVASELTTTGALVFKNPGLPITLLLFCYIELADEVLISSSAMIMDLYFGWHGSTAGLIIASLGALVLPADFVVEKASHKYSERKILLNSVLFIVVSLVAILNYEALIYDTVGITKGIVSNVEKEKDIIIGGHKVKALLNDQLEFAYDWGAGKVIYIVFLCTAFMGTIILEGVDTSLMAKCTPAQLNNAFINSGFLATLVGTLGRVLADLIITFGALLDVYVFVDFVNATMVPLLLLALLGYTLVKWKYRELIVE